MFDVYMNGKWIGGGTTVYDVEKALRKHGVSETRIESIVGFCWAALDEKEPDVAYASNGITVNWEPLL